MSMSQEEIEALMNGLDIAEDEAPAEESASDNTSLNTDEIEELISQTEETKVEEPVSIETKVEVSESIEVPDVSEVIEDIPQAIDESPVVEEKALEEIAVPEFDELESSSSTMINNDEIDDLLKDLESDVSETSDDISSDNFDDILAGIDGVQDTPPSSELTENAKEELAKNWTDSKINEGIFPLPAEADTKVVNQLSQVANDSEEKVGQIFDVLSLSLDNNNEFRTKLDDADAFILAQTKLLSSLHSKFPNIGVFEEHLSQANNVSKNLSSLKSLMNDEDMKIFEAMELMQFNDINRQKIERVMAVIRKLSLYLNNLFEDDHSHEEIAVAKHIHGDSNNDLIGDDLDKLIEEFGK